MLVKVLGRRVDKVRQCICHEVRVVEDAASESREMLVVEMSNHEKYLFVGNHLLHEVDVRDLVDYLQKWLSQGFLFESNDGKVIKD